MHFIMIIAIFVGLTTRIVAGEEKFQIHKSAGMNYLGDYQPKTLTNWTSIPEPARAKIIAHLKARLGVSFYEKLTLVGGQIVDFKALREKDPDSKNYQWEVPAYLIHLRWNRPASGIGFYDASIKCRIDGSVIEEIDLPEIAKHPERARLISTTQAVKIAKAKRFDTKKLGIGIEYRPALGVCVFAFTQVTREDPPTFFLKCLDIDAHTGKVLNTYEMQAIE